MIIDIIIVLAVISSLYRGRMIGFVRQACSTGGFFIGLFIGAWLQRYTISLSHAELDRSIITLVTTLGFATIGLTIGEYIGVALKHRALASKVNKADEAFGSVLAAITLLLSIWLLAAVSASLSISGLQSTLQKSRIITALNNTLPDAPTVIADLGALIDPNGFPDVFAGVEPQPKSGVAVPDLGALQSAVEKSQPSVVKLVGQGCGGVVDGSGFVVRPGFVATNAHVVAGISTPRVLDTNGVHRATVVSFDPNLDLAVLRVPDLAGKSLPLKNGVAEPGTPVAVLGYPGGGSFNAKPGAILDQFTAIGRNIYGRSGAAREVYEMQADVIPGNSGGPVIAADGSVVGVVFAESTTYQHVGYSLTAGAIKKAVDQAVSQNKTVSTARCAE